MSELILIASIIGTISMALGVVFSRDAVHSAFCLIFCFLGLSLCYIEWDSTFLGLIQVLIYTGAIVVLFVFVVMLLNLKPGGREKFSVFSVLVVSLAVWALSLLLLRALSHAPTGPGIVLEEGGKLPDFREISKLLFTLYLWPFEILSFFLLALIVAIFTLARPDLEKDNA